MSTLFAIEYKGKEPLRIAVRDEKETIADIIAIAKRHYSLNGKEYQLSMQEKPLDSTKSIIDYKFKEPWVIVALEEKPQKEEEAKSTTKEKA